MHSPLDNTELETFFHRLNAPLRTMPQQERAELHLEVRQHLDGLTAAYEELGLSREEALADAMRAFGNPTKIGRRMYREWRQGAAQMQTGLCLPAALHTVAWIMGLEAMSFLAMCIDFPRGVLYSMTELSAASIAFVLAPIIAGSLTGWRFGKRAVPGVFYATLPFAVVLALASGPHLSALDLAGICWFPLSSVCAYAMSAVRRGGLYRPAWSELLLRLR